MNVEIKEKLYKEISKYCKANNLIIKDFINELLQKQFMIEKYGEKPSFLEIPSKTDVKEEDIIENKPIVIEINDDDFDYKKLEMNKALKDGVFGKELEDSPKPIIEEEKKPKKHKLK